MVQRASSSTKALQCLLIVAVRALHTSYTPPLSVLHTVTSQNEAGALRAGAVPVCPASNASEEPM